MRNSLKSIEELAVVMPPIRSPMPCVGCPFRPIAISTQLSLMPDQNRAHWRDVDLGLTVGEYKIIKFMASHPGRYFDYRQIYDVIHYPGFLAGPGNDGFRGNVRSIIKRIRNKFKVIDPGFVSIENYQGFGYRWNEGA